MPSHIDTADAVQKLLRDYDTFLFDCDGVLYHGKCPVPNGPETVAMLKAMGKRVFYVTNSSRLGREELQQKLNDMGYSATMDEMCNTSFAAASFLQLRGFGEASAGHVFCIGGHGLRDEVRAVVGDRLVYANDVCTGVYDEEEFGHRDFDHNIQAVVVGFDAAATFEKVAFATVYLRENPGCLFVSTNPDATYPHKRRLLPGAGAFLAAIECASGRKPINVGKPDRNMFDIMSAMAHIDPQRAMMVGDRCDTDIGFANAAGIASLLTYSGVTLRGDAQIDEFKPTYSVDSIGDLVTLRRAAGTEGDCM